MAKDTDRFTVSIPGMSIKRIRDNRTEHFCEMAGVVYDNLKIDAVEALEGIFVETAAKIHNLTNSLKAGGNPKK